MLLAGSAVMAQTNQHVHVTHELNEVISAGKVRQRARRRLLSIFHAARALDTVLKSHVEYHGMQNRFQSQTSSMGGTW